MIYPAAAINKVLNKEIVNNTGVNFEKSFIGAKTKYFIHHWVIMIISRFSIRINFKKAMIGFLSTFNK